MIELAKDSSLVAIGKNDNLTWVWANRLKGIDQNDPCMLYVGVRF